MAFTHKNYCGGAYVTRKRKWDSADIRNMCIRHELYTRGDCEEYNDMFDMVHDSEPVTKSMYKVAKNIYDHSEHSDFGVADIMYWIEKEVVITTFEIEEIEDLMNDDDF